MCQPRARARRTTSYHPRVRRSNLRYLPAALAILVPLLAVAALGWIELRRQSVRVADAVQLQATTFLQGARLHFEQQVRGRALEILTRASLQSANLVQATRAVLEAEELVLDLFLLDASGHIVHPQLPDGNETVLPFSAPAVHEDLRLAEHLEAIADEPGALLAARRIYERHLQRRPVTLPNERARAAFRLGAVCRQLGDTAAAEECYTQARLAATMGQQPAQSVDLLSRLAVAEMLGRGHDLLELAREISENEWHPVPDELLGAAFERALAGVPLDDQELRSAASDARTMDRIRRGGRRFATDYELFAAGAIQRTLLDGRPEDLVLRTFGGGANCALLAIRPTTSEEQDNVGSLCRWVGIRLDLPALVNDAMDAFLTPGPTGHRLGVFDPDGEPILPAPDQQASDANAAPTLAGIVLRAIPVDPGAAIRDEESAIRRRVLLLAVLCLVGVAGGVVMVRSVARAAELSSLKLEFVSRVSHELKTPLALIKMYGETLALGRTTSAAQTGEFGAIVAREADRLTHQIQRILDFSKQQAGTLAYRPVRVDLSATLVDIASEVEPHVEANGCLLVTEVEGPGRTGISVDADADSLHAAVVGLLENAVKYTSTARDDRRIEIELRTERDRAVIEVRDRGIGIPAADRTRVFEPFVRGSNAGEIRGAGLGLSLVKHFADAHRGGVEALARTGGGTVIRVTLPLSKPLPASP